MDSKPNAIAAPSRRYQEIDVLRGLAALAVVFSHYIPYWNRYNSEILVWVPNSIGRDAVVSFFVISGFVIFMTLDRCRSVLDFAVLRFSRLYPAYWITLIGSTAILVLVFDRAFWGGGFFANLTMFQEFVRFSNLDNVYWSLTVELAFYLNVAVLLALGVHRFHSSIVIVWLLLSCGYALLLKQPDAELKPLYSMLLALEFSPYFSIGILFHDIVKKGWNRIRVALICLALLTVHLLHGEIEAFKTVVITGVMAAALSGWLRYSVTKVTLWLGSISYTLYLVHRNLGYALLSWFHEHQVGPAVSITIVVALALITASLITYLIEQPTQKLIRSLYARRQNAPRITKSTKSKTRE